MRLGKSNKNASLFKFWDITHVFDCKLNLTSKKPNEKK